MEKTFVVIPTIREVGFLKAWGVEFKNCSLVIVEDKNQKSIDTNNLECLSVYHYSRQDIDEEFKEESWIFSRENAGIRSYGFWKAYQEGADAIITLDDDCYPAEEGFVKKHLENLNFKAPDFWVNTYPDPEHFYTRGFPYLNRAKKEIMVSHGLWSKSIDLDALTESRTKKRINGELYPPFRQIIPERYFFPMCSMNLAFERKVVPLMFHPMMGKDPSGKRWRFNRYDDIWAGIFSKKILDYLHYGVLNGSPFIEHRKVSKVSENLLKEKEGMKVNEILWEIISEVRLTKTTPKDCYIELAKKASFPKGDYFKKLKKAMIIWANLF